MTSYATYDLIRSQVIQRLWISKISDYDRRVNNVVGGLPDDSQRKLVDCVEVGFNATKRQIQINIRGAIKEHLK